MIHTDEVAQLAPERQPRSSIVETENFVLNDEEQAIYDFIDAELDTQARAFTGSVFLAPVSVKATAKVVSALKKAWQVGGWIVEAFKTQDGGWLIAFARTTGSVSPSRIVIQALEKRAAIRAVLDLNNKIRIPLLTPSYDPNTACPLLIRMPTRGRPQQALQVLAAYRRLADSNVTIEVVLDHDDETMMNVQVLQQLCDLDVTVCAGEHKSKIDAVNSGRVNDWSILALASDDMVPIKQGYDRRIVEEMNKHFPLRDGLIYFNDGYQKDHAGERERVLCTLPILGRHYWEMFGYVYYPGYGSLYCDDEQTSVAWATKRAAFIDEVIIEHRHPAAGKAPHDALYHHNDGKWGAADKALFEMRRQKHFEMPEMLFSILICSTELRAPMLHRLIEYLRAQIRAEGRLRQIEICVEIDCGEITVGEKRQHLLERARGKWVAFIDDDDLVASDYVRRIVKATSSDPDCCSLVGVMTVDGENPQRFEHSIKYDGWYTKDGVHYRTPNHLSVVRCELARKVGFVSKNVGEDHDYSMRLRPLLKTEASTGETPLYFYFYRPKQSVQAKEKM